MTASAGKRSDVYVTAGAGVAFATEAMTLDAARLVYTVTNPVKRYWDPNTPIVFEESLNSGGAWNTVTPDTVQLVGGKCIFTTPRQLSPLAMGRVTGKYLPYSRMGGGHEYEIHPTIDILEATEFMQNSHRHVVAQDGGTVVLKRWYLDDSMRSVLGSMMALVLYVDATSQPAGPRYEMFAMLKADGLKVAVKAVEEEDLSFEIQSDVFFSLT
jgi:hypothetical protein